MSRVRLNVVSFGTAYQNDLMDYWVRPAAEKCGYDLVEYSIYDPGIRTFDFLSKGYKAWADTIRNGTNQYDLMHCLDEAAFMPGAEEVFASFPDRKIDNMPGYLQHPRCLPPIEFCYVLTWRRDLLDLNVAPVWQDFFDIQNIPGKRGVRGLPHGMIEIALYALGRDIGDVLYQPELSEAEIARQVDDALAMYDQLGDQIHWWGSSFHLHDALVKGEVVMASSWNRRVLRASEALDPGVSFAEARLQANPATAFLICDWWLIPKGTGKEEQANRLLECMYTDEEVLKSASRWCVSQANLIPVENMHIEDEFVRHHLEMGTWKNAEAPVRINSKFWGKNHDWITTRWNAWMNKKKKRKL